MDAKFSFGPFRLRYGSRPGGLETPTKRIRTRSGFRLVHIARGKKHRVTIYNPQGGLIAKVSMTDEEWKEFAGAARYSPNKNH